MLVTNNAAQVKVKSKDPRALMWAALLHDVGKKPTTRVRKGRITAYDHDKVGREMAERFLRECGQDEAFVRKVGALVRWHMQALYAAKQLPFLTRGRCGRRRISTRWRCCACATGWAAGR